MNDNLPKVLFLIMILAPVSFMPTFAQNVSYNVSDLLVKLDVAPSHVDQKNSNLPIGYVNLVSKAGISVAAPQDVAIGLSSDDPSIASVPGSVIIPKGQNYAKFEISVGSLDGETTINSVFNDVIDFQDFRVGGSDLLMPDDVEIVINLPTSNMHVNSEMPFSVFLQTPGGEVIRAPYDIEIKLEYEESLLRPDMDSMIIKKGEYYSWGVLTTNEEVGNSFVRASFDRYQLDKAENIHITSSLPVGLELNVFPQKISADADRSIDVFVSLVDSDGNPSVTPEDVRLELFSDTHAVGREFDDRMEETNVVIKTGEFGYYFRERMNLAGLDGQTILTGVSATDLGVATSEFEAVAPLNIANELAENRTLNIDVLPQIPSNTSSILVYQIVVEGPGDFCSQDVTDEDIPKGQYDVHPVQKICDGETYPVQANENIKAEGLIDKINIISSDNSLISVSESGNIQSAHSYGTAIISSGERNGEVTLATTIKGIGAATNKTEIIDVFKHVDTKIFSPTGESSLVVDKNGYFDLFLIALDGKNRPKILEENTKYILSPVNQVVEITKDKAFTYANFHSDSFSAGIKESTVVDAIPIGVEADLGLESSSSFNNQISSVVKVSLPFENLDSKSLMEYEGIVQLTDLLDNPSLASKDIRIKLVLDGPEIVSIPEHVTILEDSSYATFPITPTGLKGDSKLLASVKGVVGSETKISTASNDPKLKIFAEGVDGALEIEKPVSLTVYIDDDSAESVPGASIEFVTGSDATISPSTTRTSEDGSAKVDLTAHKGERVSIQILASASGYLDTEQNFDFDVQGGSGSVALGLPEWVLYVGLAAVIGIVAVLLMFLKKSKPIEDEDEEYEYDYEDEI